MDTKKFDLNKKFVAACLVVRNKDRTLVLRRKDWGDKICFPGGKQEEGERADDAVVREFFEETGVKVFSKDIELLGKQFRDRANGDVVFFGANISKCVGEPAVQEFDKHSFVGFLPIDHVMEEVGVKNISDPVLKFLR